jgi:hypothetical protein
MRVCVYVYECGCLRVRGRACVDICVWSRTPVCVCVCELLELLLLVAVCV